MEKPTVAQLYAIADGLACPECTAVFTQADLDGGGCHACGRPIKVASPAECRRDALRIAMTYGYETKLV